MVFKQLDVSLADHTGRAQDSDWVFGFHSLNQSIVLEDGIGVGYGWRARGEAFSGWPVTRPGQDLCC
jgi:hypothetical protein